MSVPLPDPLWLAHLQSSAAHGEPEALYALALLHLKGQGVPYDPLVARRLLRQAAQQGHESAVSLLTGIAQGHVVVTPERRDPLRPAT
jgi:TPR repeat protein